MSEDEKTSVKEDPNAIQRLDALFEVVQIHRNFNKSSTSGCDSTAQKTNAIEHLDALFDVIHTTESSAGSAQKASAKSWKERELPPSFFNAGSNPGPGMNSPDSDSESRSLRSQKSLCSSINLTSPQTTHSHMCSTSTSATSSPIVIPLLPFWKASECLTYYIDKNLQCSVNLEPAVERRRRLARGRVQKYRSRKQWRKMKNNEHTSKDTRGIHVVEIEGVH